MLLLHSVWDFRWEYQELEATQAAGAGIVSRPARAYVWRLTPATALGSQWGCSQEHLTWLFQAGSLLPHSMMTGFQEDQADDAKTLFTGSHVEGISSESPADLTPASVRPPLLYSVLCSLSPSCTCLLSVLHHIELFLTWEPSNILFLLPGILFPFLYGSSQREEWKQEDFLF